MARFSDGAVLVVALLLAAGPARAGNVEEARTRNEEATAAYALGHYAAAAESFEKAFALKPDPALLYNAAQAQRLAGNKERALLLYQNYLRFYGKGKIDKRAEIEAHIDELKQAIERDKAVATSPPTGTEPIGSGAPETGTAAASAVPATAPTPPVAPGPGGASIASAPVLVAQPAEPPATHDQPLTKRPWFWIATGGGIAAALAVVLLLTAGGSQNPSPSIGKATGN